jgi:hypothetical protein
MHGELHGAEGQEWRPVRRTLWTKFQLVAHTFFAIDISITWDHCSSVQNEFKKEQFMFNSNAIPPLLHIVPTAVLEFILWYELL